MWLYGYEKELCAKTTARGQIGDSIEGASKIFFSFCIYICVVHAIWAELDLFDHHDHACTFGFDGYIKAVCLNAEGFIE